MKKQVKRAGLNTSKTDISPEEHVESVETSTNVTEGKDGVMEVETEVDINLAEKPEEVMELPLPPERDEEQYDYDPRSQHLKRPQDIKIWDEIHQVVKVPVRDELDDKDINKTTVMTYGINSITVNALHGVKIDGVKIIQVNGDIDLPVVNTKPTRDPLDHWYVDLNAAKHVWRGLMETEVKHARKEEKAAIKVRSYMEDQLRNERF
jgi:hypothetical protein